jgi:hypothetical protein
MVKPLEAMMAITIEEAKEIREQLGLTHLVIFGVDADGMQHVATHGESSAQAKEAAEMGNQLKEALDWPADLCRSKPLPRIHENCEFYKRDYGSWCFNGWSKDGNTGHCHLEPQRTSQVGEEIACRHFRARR